ncbi:MAG TPA: serine/threonine-protein kinase, partial [Ktedonobacterales bacterium]|nr:serine/threonine-protein kinase [Ktedonobacterales bacterium]
VRHNDPGAELVDFRREARMLLGQDHRGIPRVYDVFSNANRSYLIMDYVKGDTLQAMLMQAYQEGVWLSEEQVGMWMIQLAEIVAYLHAQKPPVIFRDLKPSNIMLTPDDTIVLIDFGIAKPFAAGPQTRVGTEGYAAPEQRDGKAEPRSDIYALGAVMYQLLTGALPPMVLKSQPPRTINPSISPEMEQIILRCGEYRPDQRYQTAEEFREALERALGLAPTPSMPQTRSRGEYHSYAGDQSSSQAQRAHHTAPSMRNNDVKPLWSFHAEGAIYGAPTIAPLKTPGNAQHAQSPQSPTDALLLIGSEDNNMRAIDLRLHTQRWMYPTTDSIYGKAVVWRDMAIFGSADSFLYGVDLQTRELKWRHKTHGAIVASPCIVNDILYTGSTDGNVYAIDLQSGREIWRTSSHSKVQTTPVYGGGLIFFGAANGKMYAVDALTGGGNWSFPAQHGIFSSPTFADNHVFFGCNDHQIYCLEARSGWKAWTFSTEQIVTSSPTVVDGCLYVGSGDKRLYCLESRTGKKIWHYQTD